MFRAKYIATVSSELASMLSSNGNPYVNDGTIAESFLVEELMRVHQPIAGVDNSVSPLTTFIESLAWFWSFLHSAESAEVSSTSRYAAITNTVHKYAANHLLVPIAGAISALCGSAGHGYQSQASINFNQLAAAKQKHNEDLFTLSDFFASDESTKDWVASDDVEDTSMIYQRRLLQTLSRTVQCVSLVFSHYEDGELSVNPDCILFPMKEGFFLPLIVSRVLSNISDFVLKHFAEEKIHRPEELAIWDDEYPFGFRGSGIQLDFLLHRAYRCLHGFNILAPHLAKNATLKVPH
jgi:hypothetical protein